VTSLNGADTDTEMISDVCGKRHSRFCQSLRNVCVTLTLPQQSEIALSH
jgi:hypothetical protein